MTYNWVMPGFFAQIQDDLFPMLLGAIMLLIPIIAILTNHQQKMARLLREDQNQFRNSNESNQLRAELADLRHRIDSLTLSIEQMRDEQRTSGDVERRIRA
jgi:hypothetical protein